MRNLSVRICRYRPPDQPPHGKRSDCSAGRVTSVRGCLMGIATCPLVCLPGSKLKRTARSPLERHLRHTQRPSAALFASSPSGARAPALLLFETGGSGFWTCAEAAGARSVQV